jgi:outer membrane protein OmpA-like peptidoglycan-associated protein
VHVPGKGVKEYLVSFGIPENKSETVGNGKTQQLDDNAGTALHQDNPNKLGSHATLPEPGWAYNRRVDIVVHSKDVRSTQYFSAHLAHVVISSLSPPR